HRLHGFASRPQRLLPQGSERRQESRDRQRLRITFATSAPPRSNCVAGLLRARCHEGTASAGQALSACLGWVDRLPAHGGHFPRWSECSGGLGAEGLRWLLLAELEAPRELGVGGNQDRGRA